MGQNDVYSMVLGAILAAPIVIGAVWLAWIAARNQSREQEAFADWRKARIARYPDSPAVDLSYRRFCDETGREYYG